MHIDVPRYLGAVSRVVSRVNREGRVAHVVEATRTYDTDRADLWEALTDPDRIPRWFMPISGDLRLGGRYQLKGNAGGQITHCAPPSHLALTWEMMGDVSWVSVELSDDPAGGTRLKLEHTAHPPEEMWAIYGPGAVGVGWDLALMGLDLYLSSGVDNDHEAAEAWTMSDEGKAFITGLAKDWERAAVAGGEDAASAPGRAARTRAFYTGEALPEADEG